MARLIPISGLAEKAPACFLVETAGTRLLLDFGEGPPAGRIPDPAAIGAVDAILFSHQHSDHIGGLHHIAEIGGPALYATEIVARSMVCDTPVNALPLSGRTTVYGVSIQTGRSGHAPGGIWIHFDIGDGLLYMGDNCTTSLLYACDPPPPAGTIILDASYGADDNPLAVGQNTLDAIAAAGPLLLPAVAQGRGPELALHFARRGRMPSLDDAIRAAIVGMRRECVLFGARVEFEALIDAPEIPHQPAGVMIVSPGTAASGAAKALVEKWADDDRLQIVFSGYLEPGSPAERLVTERRARFVRWKIHPSLSENAELARAVGAHTILPGFGNRAAEDTWRGAFAPARVVIEGSVEL